MFFFIDLSLKKCQRYSIVWNNVINSIQTLIWNSSNLDKESEYLCSLLRSGNLGISISMISRVGWLFWGLENIISSSSWCCVTGPSSAIDNFDWSVSHLLESDSIDPCREHQRKHYTSGIIIIKTYRKPEGWQFFPQLRGSFCHYRCNWNMGNVRCLMSVSWDAGVPHLVMWSLILTAEIMRLVSTNPLLFSL